LKTYKGKDALSVQGGKPCWIGLIREGWKPHTSSRKGQSFHVQKKLEKELLATRTDNEPKKSRLGDGGGRKDSKGICAQETAILLPKKKGGGVGITLGHQVKNAERLIGGRTGRTVAGTRADAILPCRALGKKTVLKNAIEGERQRSRRGTI